MALWLIDAKWTNTGLKKKATVRAVPLHTEAFSKTPVLGTRSGLSYTSRFQARKSQKNKNKTAPFAVDTYSPVEKLLLTAPCYSFGVPPLPNSQPLCLMPMWDWMLKSRASEVVM